MPTKRTLVPHLCAIQRGPWCHRHGARGEAASPTSSPSAFLFGCVSSVPFLLRGTTSSAAAPATAATASITIALVGAGPSAFLAPAASFAASSVSRCGFMLRFHAGFMLRFHALTQRARFHAGFMPCALKSWFHAPKKKNWPYISLAILDNAPYATMC